MRRIATPLVIVLTCAFALTAGRSPAAQSDHDAAPRTVAGPVVPQAPLAAAPAVQLAQQHVTTRLQADLDALQLFRPAYRFWRHIFTIRDGFIAFGSGVDGRLVGTLPVRGDWGRAAVWEDASLRGVLAGRVLRGSASKRRDEVARLLEPVVGPVVHNQTRGLFLLPNAQRYGPFLREWGAIYERFGVPPQIGLAQAVIESGLNGAVRSEARAMGFCQWLPRNWNRLKRLSPHPIEGHNQTTQAPYCAAYLAILATKYGSFIPALSEHHTGGTNVGRTLINGERLGGAGVRERYFIGAELARDLRALSPGRFKRVYGTYGPRSFLYAEMVFGNTATVADLMASIPQAAIFAMRTPRALTPAAIAREARLPADEVRRYNPALQQRVPAGGTLYLPLFVPAFGADVSFWHRPADDAYASVLNDFLRVDASVEEWDSPAFDATLADFRQRFAATGTEEGTVMATTLAYFMEDRRTSRQGGILAEFRTSEPILRLFEQARVKRDALRIANAAAPVTTN